MVKYLFVIFYLCVVMFLNWGTNSQKTRHVVMVVAGMRDINRKLTIKLISPDYV